MELLSRLFRLFMGFLNYLLQIIEKIHRGSASSQLPKLDGDIAGIGKKVNDSLFSLYEPADPNAELVFFHGVIEKACDDMHVRAWMSSNVCWPAVWLQDEEDFPRARILSVKYDSSLEKSRKAGVFSMKTLVEALAADLTELSDVGQTGGPVVLVGHDLGGLVIKALCVYLATHISLYTGRRERGDVPPWLDHRITRFEDFLRNVRGIFYFSTPHTGLNFVGGKTRFDGELVRFLELLNSDTANLNDDFEKLRCSRKWMTAGLGPLIENPESSLRVCEGAVRPDADIFNMVSESMETINKPDSRQSSSYQTFVSHVKHFVQAEVEEDSDLEFKGFMRNTVGLENVVRDLCRIAREVEGRISGLLLHGMGGIGKSTLGKALFLKLSRNFHRHCRFQFDRDAVYQPHRGTTELQNSLLDCLGEHRSSAFRGQGQAKLKKCYKSFKRPILLFIDNIEEEEDLEHIFPGPIGELLQQGSYIILASRNSRLLSRLRVIGLVDVHLHEMKELDEASANELFCRRALFDRVKAHHGEWKDVRKVLSTCSRLPLALKVVGAALAPDEGTSRSSRWSVDQVLERLKNWLSVDGRKEDQLMRSLEFSYSELDEDTKHVFLDIVFCFQGSPWNELRVLYGDRLDVLKRRALIKKETHKAYGNSMRFPVIKVHALLGALGEKKGRDLGTHIKLDVQEDDNIDEDLSIKKGQGIVLVICGTIPISLDISRLKCFTPFLRILILRDVLIRGTFACEDTPRNLKCFVSANSSVPFAGGDLSRLNKLIHVDIASTIAEHESYIFPRGLQKLRLETPRARDLRFPSEEKGMELKELGLMSISALHFRISMSQSLTKLILQGIKGLRNNLPGEMFQLRTLESLSIRYCEYISVIPELQTEHLQYLYFALPNLESLPSSLRNLKHLRSLGLENCSLIEQLPCGVSMLSNPELNCILIGGCPKLKLLPPGFEADQQTTGSNTQGFEVQEKSVYFKLYCTARIPSNSEIMEEAEAATQMPPLIEQMPPVEKLSDCLYQLYEPSPASSANLDIYFFHGLECEGVYSRDAHLLTWKSSGEKEEIWPQKWISEDFPQARIISVSYDGSMKQTASEGHMDLFLIGETIESEILMHRQYGPHHPVILVGHGFGGIVMKELCRSAHRRMSILLESIRGFYFYDTPHLGMGGMEPPVENEGALVRSMRLLNKESLRLHEEFSEMLRRRRCRWTVYGLGGTESKFGRQGLEVHEASTRFGDNYRVVSGDHFTVCRPSDKFSRKYVHLHNLIENVQRQVQLEEKALLMVPKITVGVDALLTQILGKHIRDNQFVGFYGMGGVGKTTLSKVIFNELHAKFEYYCFVEEIKQISGTKDEVKRKIWEKMFHHGVPVRSASGSSGGGDGWYQVKWRSLLVVFDDVEDIFHVKLLKEIAHENGLAESRFILTSRDMSCLRDCGPEYRIHICRLDSLDYEDATKLFITHAFPGQQEPPESFKSVVKQIVDGCEGLPLSLEVLGKYLRGNDIEMWEEIPTALRECDLVASLQEKVWSKLQLSYDRLPGEVKQIFLDIALSFKLRDPFSVDDAVKAWRVLFGQVYNRLQILQDRALVSIYYDENDLKQFYMHEHLKRMGQRIARREGRSLNLSQV